MSRYLIKNVTLILPDGLAENQSVLCDSGKIAGVYTVDQVPDTAAYEVLDAGDAYLASGFIDLHIHGTGEFLAYNGPDDLAELCKLLPRYGVTGYLPTLMPRPKDEDAEFLAALAEVRSEGAAILGFHLEGPFLAISGALPPDALGGADLSRMQALIKAGGLYPAVFSISPELDGVTDLIESMATGGTPVFITHTKADVKQTQAAIDAGARHATHFYDVFPLPGQSNSGVRPCGAVEAILSDPRVSVDFILDGVHVDPAAVRMALQCKGPEGVCLITDANIGAGSPPGRYCFGREEVEFAYPGAPARGTENSSYPGELAGSGLTMDQAVRNAVEMLDVDIPLAVRMASMNPAAVLGLSDSKGRVASGYDADLVLLDDELQVLRTWVAGVCVFSRQS